MSFWSSVGKVAGGIAIGAATIVAAPEMVGLVATSTIVEVATGVGFAAGATDGAVTVIDGLSGN